VGSPYDDREILDVWVEFKATNCEKIRNYFMERYLPLVRYNAERVHSKLPDEVDVDDLKQAGIFGLMDAINAFSLDRGVKFETYCAPRIRGAILDELRAMDWVPRLVRSRTSKVEKARKRLEMASGRKPTEQEIAKELDVDMDEYRKMAKDAGPTGVVSLNRKWYETDSNKDVREIDVLKDERQTNPLNVIQKRDLKDMLTKGLSRAERLIVILYYYEEMTMKEIGLTLDLSESRVSQMHSSILARLRAQVRTQSKELESEE
jgi:RNA polymerase sigma factor for flagellar operon FliA